MEYRAENCSTGQLRNFQRITIISQIPRFPSKLRILNFNPRLQGRNCMNCRNFPKTTNVLLVSALLLYCTGCGGYGGGGTGGGGGSAPSAPTGLVAAPVNAAARRTW